MTNEVQLPQEELHGIFSAIEATAARQAAGEGFPELPLVKLLQRAGEMRDLFPEQEDRYLSLDIARGLVEGFREDHRYVRTPEGAWRVRVA